MPGTPSSQRSSLPPAAPDRLPVLDGLRGIAILLVLYCHGTVIEREGLLANLMRSTAEISWIGVDLFFVLSGFLITGILFDAKGQPHYFRNFYARRTLRIFPLYYAVLLLFMVIIPAWAPGLAAQLGLPPEQPIWYWLYLSNIYQAFEGQSHVLDVTWSLAIEEQFYLLWPVVVLLMGRRALMWTAVVMFLSALSMRTGLRLTGQDWSLAAFLTPCRLDALATGAWIALYIRGPGSGERLLRAACVVGPTATVTVVALLGGTYLAGYRSGIVTSAAYSIFAFSLFALAFGSLLVISLSLDPARGMGRVLSNRWLLVFGQYSYAIYLLHDPIMVLLADSILGPERFAFGHQRPLVGQLLFYILSFSASLAAGWLSWHLFEKHFLALKRFFPSPKSPTAANAWQPTSAPGPHHVHEAERTGSAGSATAATTSRGLSASPDTQPSQTPGR